MQTAVSNSNTTEPTISNFVFEEYIVPLLAKYTNDFLTFFFYIFNSVLITLYKKISLNTIFCFYFTKLVPINNISGGGGICRLLW
ncbi:MAG: hypothetical protein [Cotesia congregata filamentous virus 2]